MEMVQNLIRNLSAAEKLQFYSYHTKPVLNFQALFTDGSSNYMNPVEPKTGDEVTVRFRTARENAEHVPVEDKPNYKFVKGDIADEAFIMDLFEKEKFEDYKTDLGTDSSVTPDFTEADDFLKFIQKNRRSVPSKERIADKDKFIKTVYELSNSFEIDADLIEFAEGYIANIYVDYACYTGYIKKLLAILFILADDISFLDGSKENADMLFSFTYHTHHIFLNNRETTDFS